MRNTGKFQLDLTAALHACDAHEPTSLTLNELVRAYDARH